MSLVKLKCKHRIRFTVLAHFQHCVSAHGVEIYKHKNSAYLRTVCVTLLVGYPQKLKYSPLFSVHFLHKPLLPFEENIFIPCRSYWSNHFVYRF